MDNEHRRRPDRTDRGYGREYGEGKGYPDDNEDSLRYRSGSPAREHRHRHRDFDARDDVKGYSKSGSLHKLRTEGYTNGHETGHAHHHGRRRDASLDRRYRRGGHTREDRAKQREKDRPRDALFDSRQEAKGDWSRSTDAGSRDNRDKSIVRDRNIRKRSQSRSPRPATRDIVDRDRGRTYKNAKEEYTKPGRSHSGRGRSYSRSSPPSSRSSSSSPDSDPSDDEGPKRTHKRNRRRSRSRSPGRDGDRDKRKKTSRRERERSESRERRERRKEKKRKHRERDKERDTEERRSILTGKKIKLKVKKEKGDHERDANRQQLLTFLNSAYE